MTDGVRTAGASHGPGEFCASVALNPLARIQVGQTEYEAVSSSLRLLAPEASTGPNKHGSRLENAISA